MQVYFSEMLTAKQANNFIAYLQVLLKAEACSLQLPHDPLLADCCYQCSAPLNKSSAREATQTSFFFLILFSDSMYAQ